MSTPVDVVIHFTQYTEGLDPMIIQFSAKDPTHPLIGAARQIQTTQRAVAGVGDEVALADVVWTDSHCRDMLAATCAEWGLPVNVVQNVQPVPVGVTREESIVAPVEGPQP
jgi:hypothetical protein